MRKGSARWRRGLRRSCAVLCPSNTMASLASAPRSSAATASCGNSSMRTVRSRGPRPPGSSPSSVRPDQASRASRANSSPRSARIGSAPGVAFPTDAAIEIGDPLQTAIAKVRTTTRAAFADAPDDADAVANRVVVLAGLARAEEALPEVAATQLREELSSGLRRYLERRAATSPLVLVFEDIHWAESGLLELIAYLAESSRAPLLLLCLSRPEFRESVPTWGSRL